jgi:hypothetical protein
MLSAAHTMDFSAARGPIRMVSGGMGRIQRSMVVDILDCIMVHLGWEKSARGIYGFNDGV